MRRPRPTEKNGWESVDVSRRRHREEIPDILDEVFMALGVRIFRRYDQSDQRYEYKAWMEDDL